MSTSVLCVCWDYCVRHIAVCQVPSVAMVTDHQVRNSCEVVGMHAQHWSSELDQLLQSNVVVYSSTQFLDGSSLIKSGIRSFHL